MKQMEERREQSREEQMVFHEARKQYEKDMRVYNKQIKNLTETEIDQNATLDESKFIMPRVGEFNLTAE